MDIEAHQPLQNAEFTEDGEKILMHIDLEPKVIPYVYLATFMLLLISFFPLALFWLIFGWWTLRNWFDSTSVVVTPTKISYKSSSFLCCCRCNRSEKNVMIDNITDVTLQQGCIQACFGIYTILIQNPGQSVQNASADLALTGVRNPKEVRDILLRLRTDVKSGRAFEPDYIPPTPGTTLGPIAPFTGPRGMARLPNHGEISAYPQMQLSESSHQVLVEIRDALLRMEDMKKHEKAQQ